MNNAQETRQRLEELRREQALLEQQLRVQEYASSYPIQLEWPPHHNPSNRTDLDLIQFRLLEAGVLFDVPTTVGDTVQAVNSFIQDLERTGCYHAVQVQLGQAQQQQDENEEPKQTLNVILDEKRWYRLHAGGGIKTFDQETYSSDSFLPTGEVDVSVGLRNAGGCLDKTDLQYSLDTKSIPSWSLIHERPLYTILPDILRYPLLEQATGSQYSFVAKAALDTVDYEFTRSYKEYQRLLSVKLSNQHSIMSSEQSPHWYHGLEWSTILRDLVPRRCADLPFALDASPEVVSQAGPSVKHSIAAEFRTNGHYLDHPFNPTAGFHVHAKAELATPPGDVGFAKCQAGTAMHMPLTSSITLHGVLNMGYLKSLLFGGLCRPATLSDRYYVGGPLHLRGFGPAGIGPRAVPGGSVTPNGDALGGDFYYTATCMTSMKASNLFGRNFIEGLRVFSFVSAGTCVGAIASTPLTAVVQSSRLSVGVGLATTALGPRLETTYSWPIRFGPADARRHWQFGLGFSFG